MARKRRGRVVGFYTRKHGRKKKVHPITARRGRVIRVKRKGYYRGPYTIHRDGKEIRIPRHYVPPTTYTAKDRGAPGKGKKLIKVKKGKMTKYAIKLGYIKPGQRISDIPNSKIDDFARDLAKEVGPRKAFLMFHAQVVFRKRERNGFKTKMMIGREAIAKAYGEALTPREAIRKWRSMTPLQRAKAMPGGAI